MEPGCGQTIGTLEIERELGRGAFGVVYAARDRLLGRRVALKVVRSNGTVPPDAREQVLTEARLIARLQTPYVVTLYRLHDTEDGDLLLEMELVEGGSLEDRLSGGRTLPLPEAIRVFRELCLALRSAHASRVIHGDIKPANVLFGPKSVTKLADFGIARMLERGKTSESLGGTVQGSPLYMAPEVISGRETGMASDLWSATVLLYECLTGRTPFPATTYPELASLVLHGEPDPLAVEVPEELSRLIARGLAKAPEDRPSSIEEVLEELDRLAGEHLGAGPVALGERRTNVAIPVTAFVGREREMESLGSLLLEPDTRLVTLLGPGGIGKTRLSRQLCDRLVTDLPGGAWFVDLSAATGSADIAVAVAEALDVEIGGQEEPVQAAGAALAHREACLLVLDNFEQVTEEAEATIGVWRDVAPEARLLVTSRIPIGRADEIKVELSPLGLDIAGEAVHLFVQRAKEADSGFLLSVGDTMDIERIVRELEGMPLAIELAAARVRMLGISGVSKHIGRKFDLLKSTRRDVTDRQRTLENAIEWSFDLLETWEQEAFLQAACFRDGFTLAAAEEVIDLSGHDRAPAVKELMLGLREKSLLTATDAGPEPRLGMYRAIREYGERRLTRTHTPEQTDALERRHQDFYLSYAEGWSKMIPGPRDQEAFDRIAADLGNVEVLIERARVRDDARSAVRAGHAAAETVKVRRTPAQLADFVEGVLTWLPEDDGMLLTWLAAAGRMSGEWEEGSRAADRAVAASRGGGDEEALALALAERGAILRSRGELDAALASSRDGLEVAERIGFARGRALNDGGGGLVLIQKSDFDLAHECFLRAEEIALEIGDHQTLALNLGNRGVVYESWGEREKAIACHRQAEDLNRRIGNRIRVAVSLGLRANVLAQLRRFEEAFHCYSEAESIARELGALQRVAQIVGNRGAVHMMRRELDEALRCYVESENLARRIGDRRRIALSVGRRARIHEIREEWDRAIGLYETAEQLAREMGDRVVLARNVCNRGCLLAEQERWDEAWETLSAGIAIYDELHANRSDWYFDFKAILADVADHRGDRESARRIAREGLELAGFLGVDETTTDEASRESFLTLERLADEGA